MSIENMKMVSEAEAQAVTIRKDAQTEACLLYTSRCV